MTKIDEKLKYAILSMPQQEKDKLLLRLISKDYVLIEKLSFQLLQDNYESVAERRTVIINDIKKIAKQNHYSSGLLMMAMRDINGAITFHVKVTKDKYGEVLLTILLVNLIYEDEENYKMVKTISANNATFGEYVAKKAAFVLEKIKKMDKADSADFVEYVNKMLNYIYTSCASSIAAELKLPKSWSL